MLQVIEIFCLAILCFFSRDVGVLHAGEYTIHQEVEEITAKPKHPVFTQEIIYINNPGEIISLKGKAYFKKKKNERYVELYRGAEVEAGDILELLPGASLTIMFDENEITLHAEKNTRWFVLKRTRGHPLKGPLSRDTTPH